MISFQHGEIQKSDERVPAGTVAYALCTGELGAFLTPLVSAAS